MSSNSFGEILKVTTWGESHGPAIGAVVDGVPAGLEISEAQIQRDMNRRKPGTGPLVSTRQEPDQVRILSGVFEGVTLGTPISLLIENRDARPEDYADMPYRPGHADYTWKMKFGRRDHRGGGRASGRETAARVAAAAVARALLRRESIGVAGGVLSIGGCKGDGALERVKAAACDGDSVGGLVEVRAFNVPPGLGEPVFDKLEARLGAALLSIGSIKGVEFGDGFALSSMMGSEANDPITPLRDHPSNHCGGMLGGISNGDTLIMRCVVKPTPSIAKAQQTMDAQGNPVEISIKGRHDPCVALRVVPVAEAMVCLVLADFLLLQRTRTVHA